jgi:glutathione reductase (NADPH)
MLVSGAEAIDFASRMRGHGVTGELDIDWPELIAFKRSFTDAVSAKHERMYASKGIETFHGRARFISQSTIKVDDEVLEGRHFLIAAGAEPVKVGIPGEEHLATSEDFLNLERLPRRIVLVGGGYIAAEFSHIAARAGAKVTILQRGERMLAQFDPDLVGWLMEKFAEIGIDVRTQTEVESIEKTDTGFTVRASSEGKSIAVETDLVVHAAGRAPALDALDLRAAAVSVKSGRLELNEYLQSVSNPAVYASGDAAQMGPPLTPVSSHDAKIAAANMLEGNKLKPNYAGVPSVAFSVPPIAAVGLSEAEVRRQGLRFRVKSQKASDWYTARRVAETTYGFKVLVQEGTDRILGAHLVGPHVDEVINVFALAIGKGLTAEDLKTTIFAYPTGASDIGYMV